MDRYKRLLLTFLRPLLCVLAFENALCGAELGQRATPLQVERWINGGPLQVGNDSQTNLVVITFFESGCDGCMAALPKLFQLQNRLKPQGVRFAGLSTEPAETVAAFAQGPKLGGALNFPLGADKQHGTYDAYMTGFGRVSVPWSFVVDSRGMIAWEGTPLAGLEQALDQLLAGTYDWDAAKRIAGAEKLQAEYFTLVSETTAFEMLSLESKRVKAQELGRKIMQDGASNPWLLNNFAWKILTDQKIKARDLPLAIEVSRLACERDKTANCSFVDTYARALFQAGRLTEAVEQQAHAITICDDPVRRSRLERTLWTYQEAKRAQAQP